MAVVTLSEVKTHLGISHADDDSLLNQLVTQGSSQVEDFTGRAFTETSRTEYLDGGGEHLIVKVPPIASITTITEDGGAGDVVTATDYDFYPDEGLIFREAGEGWSWSRRYWEVVYVGGFDGAPDTVKLWTLALITMIYEGRDIALTSQSIGDWSRSADVQMRAIHDGLAAYRLPVA